MVSKRETVRLTVEQHFEFRAERPEAWPWSRVVNPRVASIAVDLATEIVLRRAEWETTGRSGSDPLIGGMREALRRIARTAVWATMSQEKAQRAVRAQVEREIDSDGADTLSDHRWLAEVPLSPVGPR